MRTVCGIARSVQRLVVRRRPAPTSVPPVRLLAAGRRPLIVDRLGEQRHAGAVLDQVDGTTCGSAVLLARAAWADPAELARLGAPGAGQSLLGAGFGARYDARQKQVHGETNRFWPQSL